MDFYWVYPPLLGGGVVIIKGYWGRSTICLVKVRENNMHGKKCGMGWFSWLLLVIGALNWGLIGLGNLFGNDWDVVNRIIGSWPALESIVYILVGIAGLMLLFGGCKCEKCKA